MVEYWHFFDHILPAVQTMCTTCKQFFKFEDLWSTFERIRESDEHNSSASWPADFEVQ